MDKERGSGKLGVHFTDVQTDSLQQHAKFIALLRAEVMDQKLFAAANLGRYLLVGVGASFAAIVDPIVR